MEARTSGPVQLCLLFAGSSLPSPRLPAPNKCQKLEQLETEIVLPTRAEQAGGKDWRPFRQCGRKRNSVNPPLIRYNGSLVVCPVRTRSPQVDDTVGPDTLKASTHLPQSQHQRRIMVGSRCGAAVELRQPVNPERTGRMFTDNHVFDQPTSGTF